jgi:hypothetical protein
MNRRRKKTVKRKRHRERRLRKATKAETKDLLRKLETQVPRADDEG